MKDPILSVSALVKSYPGNASRALDGIDLFVPAGSFFGLLGPNGAGKTTLISILCGILAPDGGAAHIRSASGEALNPRSARGVVGLVPQDLAFYPTLTVRENLRFFGAMQGLRGKLLNERVDACVAVGRLEETIDQRAERLSGGLKRRLNFALGLLHAPGLVVLDEPTAGMDAQSRNFLREELKRLNASGTTILYTSHYLEEIEQLCDRLAIIDHGRVIAAGRLDALLEQDLVTLHVDASIRPEFVARLRGLPSVSGIREEQGLIAIITDNPQATLAGALALAREDSVAIAQAGMGARNLESLYFQLTGTRLRDGHDTADVA
ncbi:MAG: ABC transporter ATP-binding protein [Burkholderiales bacterium]